VRRRAPSAASEPPGREPISLARSRRREFESDESTADHNDVAGLLEAVLIPTASASVRK